MKPRIFSDNDSMSLASAELMAECARRNPTALFCFAAGKTQAETYRILAGWVRDGILDLSRIRVVGLDDMAGTRRDKQEGFYYFLDIHLFRNAGIGDEQITFFDAAGADLEYECRRIDAYLDREGPIDFLLLGIGMNGHIGYNEPGSQLDGRSHLVRLESSSVQAGSAYFDHAVSADTGITLGLRDLFAAKTILVQANQSKKAEIVRRVVEGPIDEGVPATLLRRREDVLWYFDAEAGSKLKA